MNRLPRTFARTLTATVAALVLTSSLALAAEPAAKPAPAAPAPAAGHGMRAHGQQGGMALAALSPEKQEIARTLMAAHAQALAPLHQSLYAKGMELEALNAAGEGESAKARAAIRDIADLEAKMLTENAKFRAQMVKKTGLRTPVMGHGMMGGQGGMMGGMMGGKGMMGQGGMSCPMMQGKAGGQGGHAGHGAAAQAPAGPAGAPAASAPAADPHAGHGN